MKIKEQVSIIFAGVNGYLDDIPANKIKAFEEYLNIQIDSKYKDFVTLFEKNLAMTDEVKSALKKVLEETKATFQA